MDIDMSQPPEPLPADETDESLPTPLPADATDTMAPTNGRGVVADMAVAAVHGLETAARQTVKTGLEVGRHLLPPAIRDAVDPAGYVPDQTLTPAPETVIGKLESDVIRFGVGFIGAGKFIKGAGLVAGAAKSMMATAFTADPHADRLGNLIQDYPFLQNPVTDYLQAKDGDTFAEGKLKASIEDLGLSAIAGTLVKTFTMVKGALKGTKPVAVAGKVGETASNPLAAVATPADDVVSTIMAGPTVGEAASQRAAKLVDSLKDSGLNLTTEDVKAFASELDTLTTSSQAALTAKAGKEGFVNADKLMTGIDTKATINRFGAVLGPIMQRHGWTEKQTHKATFELAELLGETPDVLMGSLRLLGKQASEIPQTLVAGRMLVQSQADELFAAATKATITGQGKKEALQHLRGLADTLADIKMIQTGAARATESGKIPVAGLNPDRFSNWLKGFKNEDDALRAIQMTEGNVEALAKMARTMPDKIGDVAGSAWRTHNTYWINAILSGPKTHVVNVASTATNALMQPLNLIAGGIVKRDYADVREGLAVYNGMRKYLFDSFKMSAQAFRTEMPVLGGANTIEDTAKLVAIETSQSLWAKTLRFPSRMLGAEDEFFKQLAYRAKLSAQAARSAADEVKAGRLAADGVDDFIKNTFDAGFDKDGAALAADALEYAERVTFTGSLKTATWLDGQSFGESVQGMAQSHPWMRGTILPFVRTPVNLMRQVFDYMPVLGQLRKQFWLDIEAGGVKQSEAIGRVLVGSGLWTGAGMLALEGRITGAAPRDPELAAQLLATGWRPYSWVWTHDDGTKTYISFQRFDPFGMFLGLSADMTQTLQHIPAKKAEDFAALATLSLSNNLMSKSYLTGITELTSVLASENERQIEKYIQRKVTSYIPAVVNVAQADVGLKEVRSLMDAIMQKIPGFSSTLEPKRGLFGEKLAPQVGWPMSALNPFTVSHSVDSRVTDELARLAQSDSRAGFDRPATTHGNVDLLAYKNAAGRTAYDRLSEESGKGLASEMAKMMESSAYQNGTDGSSFYKVGSRVGMVRELIDRHRTQAMVKVRREYPALDAALRKDQVNRTRVRHGAEELDILKTLNQ